MRSLIIVVAVAMGVFVPGAGLAATDVVAKTYVSGPERVSLIELYTSQGCSSCPPADEWLAAFADSSGLWRDFVPVAFHVDYWDHLGWKDPFAAPGNGERQRRYANEWESDAVYTPAVVLDGKEWRDWRRQRPADLTSSERVGTLRLTNEGEAATVVFDPVGRMPEELRLELVVLGFDLVQNVTRGENAGRALSQDFVVLGRTGASMNRAGAGYPVRVTLPRVRETRSARYAVAAWVARRDDPAPIQAVGGWLDGLRKGVRAGEKKGTGMSDKVTKSDAEWRELLTDEQYYITREKGTERAFTGRYWDFKEEGLYLCVACGQALFDSETKYESGSGWPSFWEPVDPGHVDQESDRSLGMVRTEVSCSRCGAHLGHVFPDGPEPTGLRYCINSAALEFVKKKEEGNND